MAALGGLAILFLFSLPGTLNAAFPVDGQTLPRSVRTEIRNGALPTCITKESALRHLGQLKKVLLTVRYHELFAFTLGTKYGVHNLYTINSSSLNHLDLPLNSRTLSAGDFFMRGKPAPTWELNDFGLSTENLHALVCLNILESLESGQFRMNNLLVETYEVAGKPLFFLVSSPESAQKEEPSRLFISSYALFTYLQMLRENGDLSPKGRWVDFGSGNGFLGISLLATDPNGESINEVIGLEIIPSLLEISRINAMLNGVSDRFVPLLNADPKNLIHYLGNTKINGVISNPPSLPNPLGYPLPIHSGGGYFGLDVILLMLNQLAPMITDDGQILMFAMLSLDEEGLPYLRSELASRLWFKIHHPCFTLWDHPKLIRTQFQYARFLKRRYGSPFSKIISLTEVLLGLSHAGIEGVSPYFISLHARGGGAECPSKTELKAIDPYL